MASNLEIWARTERGFLQEEIKHLRAGGKVISPSGDDISAEILKQRELRLEHLNLVLTEIEGANLT